MRKSMGVVFIVAGVLLVVAGVFLLSVRSDSGAAGGVRGSGDLSARSGVESVECARSERGPASDDEAHRKGEAFERWVVGHFNKKYWRVDEWRGDKYTDGRGAESNKNPDLELTFTLNGKEYPIAVECKYRGAPYRGKVCWSSPAQLERYRDYASRRSIPVYVAIGMGGDASDPEEVYIVPLKDMPSHEVTMEFLSAYRRKHVSHNFFYDIKKGMLSCGVRREESCVSYTMPESHNA